MTALLTDPHFYLGAAAGLLVGFILGFLMAALRGNDHPEIVGAIWNRCRVCGSRVDGDSDICLRCDTEAYDGL